MPKTDLLWWVLLNKNEKKGPKSSRGITWNQRYLNKCAHGTGIGARRTLWVRGWRVHAHIGTVGHKFGADNYIIIVKVMVFPS